ncbi:CPBP family intramembrane glutamic endopeptidase [Nocardiopsis changdeensis]|uniref:CPBP family intramembrane metalloprotease n=1 Tax=Nocardiopsis changdeensis TaxID=2831969 RepID=A0ABX8BNQ1_9ACTN|nr:MULTISPECIES: CPBP family intramembrane glutamic endopeptidase [Nocardiopsis]QUX23869.1 CPBP family intramembrane metalloprotease [Nocardiopsis changdeensis]QYX39815.1 CPBP family intramembrane metalloprotease [Nocardiopsis sp. MT53]
MGFSVWGLALVALIVLYLVAVEPWWGRRAYTELERVRDTDPRALTRMFGQGIAVWWGLTGVALLAVLVSPGVGLAELGLVPMNGEWGTLAGAVVGMAVAMAAVALAARKAPGFLMPGQKAVAALLPRTARERWWGAGASVTAGICEELVYRGLFIAAGVGLGLDPVVAAGISLGIFVLGHLYQGPVGLVFVTLVGFVFTNVYLATGSLFVPIVLHILLDLRSLAFAPRREEVAAR